MPRDNWSCHWSDNLSDHPHKGKPHSQHAGRCNGTALAGWVLRSVITLDDEMRMYLLRPSRARMAHPCGLAAIV